MVRKLTWQKDPVLFERIRVRLRPLIDIKKMKEKFAKMPPALKWTLSVIAGGFIYKAAETIVNTYIKFSFSDMQAVNAAFRTQFLIDVLLIIVVFSLLFIVFDMQRRYG